MDTTASAFPPESDAEVEQRLIDQRLIEQGLIEQRLADARTGNGHSPARLTRRETSAGVASFGQERLWFLERWGAESGAAGYGHGLYNVPLVLRLHGPVAGDVLRRCVELLVTRHAVLRSGLAAGADGRVRVVTAEHAEVPWAEADARAGGWPAGRDVVRAAVCEPFDVAVPPLVRGGLVRCAEDGWLAWLSVHHAACDGWSVEVLLSELTRAYRALAADGEPELEPLAASYEDFAAWQREAVSRVADAEVVWWRDELAGAPAVLELPADRPRPAVASHRGGTLRWDMDPGLVAGVRELSRACAATAFEVLLAAFAALVTRWTGSTDVVVGSPVAGRNLPELEPMVGFFVNTLVLRVDTGGDPSFDELAGRVRHASRRAQEHADVPFEVLVDALVPERDVAVPPLVQVVFGMHQRNGRDWQLGGGVHARLEGADTGTSKFDLTCSVIDAGDGMAVELEYASDLFDAATVDRFAAHWTELLGGLTAAGPAVKVSAVRALPAAECELLATWSGARGPAAVTGSLGDAVAAQAAARPGAVAVADSGTGVELTYAELLERADALAGQLRDLGAGPGSLVGLACGRGAELVIGMLGIVRAGAAYVPLDPAYPAERISYMLTDSRVRTVVTQPHVSLPAGGYQALIIDATRRGGTRASATAPAAAAAPVPDAGPDDPAYLIYTSGSTGKPKAVVVTHRNALRLFEATCPDFTFGPEDVWTLLHSASFDFSVWEAWGALTTGGRLVVVSYWDSREPEALYDLVARERVTVLNQTPAAFAQFTAVDEGRGADLALRAVVFGGDALDRDSVLRWWRRHPHGQDAGSAGLRLINMYGVTETTVHVTFCELTPELLARHRSPIGQPIADLSAYVLGPDRALAPVGVPGELYVGGAGVACGYLNQPALTAQRFVPDPFGAEPGGRLYRTGDRARWCPDGTLEFLGRADHQIKIRGFRIEPAEVEAAILTHQAAQACAVVAHGGGPADRRLVAYVVTRPDADPRPDVAAIRDHVAAMLPSHLVPAIVMFLDALPTTANGKLDRDRLPVPGEERPAFGQGYAAPRTEAETVLAEIWAEVLDVARVGIHDNFFHLGGDSIRAIQVLALARQRGIDFPLQRLFQHATIAALVGETTAPATPAAPAERVREPFSMIGAADRARLPGDVADAYPMAVLQAGMVFHMESDEDRRLYQNLDSFHVRAPFREDAFRLAVRQLVERHDILRTSFHLSEYSQLLQLVHERADLPIEVIDVRERSEPDQLAAIARLIDRERAIPFDLTRPPLLRFFVHLRSEHTFQWTLAEHHAILDGWSLHSTIAEVLERYMALLRDPSSPPQPKPRSAYRDFIEAEQEALGSEESRDFWLDRMRDAPRVRVRSWPRGVPADPLRVPAVPAGAAGTELPEWQLRERHLGFYGWLETKIPAQLSRRLEEISARCAVPLKHVLLAAHMRVISYLSGSDEVATGMALNGRLEEVDGALCRGLYLNSLPFRARIGTATWTELIRQVFDQEQAALPHRRYPMAEIQRLTGGEQLYDTHFVYNHFHVLRGVLDAGEVAILDPKINSFTTTRIEPTNYPFVAGFVRDPRSDALLLSLDCHLELFPEEQVRRVRDYYLAALRALAEDPDRPAAGTSLISGAERDQIQRWNGTRRSCPIESSVDDLVAAFARSRPEAIAVTDGPVTMSYATLQARADGLAERLRAAGVARGDLVGLCCRRSADLIAGMLGILRAGAAYVPLDPDYPPERLAFMLDDTGVRVAVAHQGTLDGLPRGGLVIIGAAQAFAPSAGPAGPGTGGADTACLVYTSGSTGQPKGVLVPHRGIVRLVRETGYADLTADSVVAQISNASFDPLIFEAWGALANGGRLVIVPTGVSLDPAGLTRLLRAQKVTTAAIVTGLFNTTVGEVPDAFGTLRQVFIGGESISPARVRAAIAAAPAAPASLRNIYGPTEVTSISTCQPMPQPPDSAGQIGRPIANTQAWVVDSQGDLVPVGVPGEILLGGPGVAHGYWGRPALTAERFVPDPFSGESGVRLYRTGDLGAWRPDGTLEFLGRRDHQVKIRGFRVEPGETEAALAEHPAVEAAAVVAYRPGGGPARLTGYVQPVSGSVVSVAGIREFLAARLPDYLIPSVLIVMDRIPRSPNGKVDHKALPAPSSADGGQARQYVAPRDWVEEAIAGIWSEVLSVPRVGALDNFFELGGHSLQAVQVAFRIRTGFQVELSIRDILGAPTVEALAGTLNRVIAGSADQDLAAALDAVERLSDESVRALLDQS